MNVFQAIFLGLVQGFTEFLPISSSGHLVLFQQIFGIGKEALAFDIVMHIATLIAVTAVFRKELWHMIRRPFSKITLLIIVATIPTAVIGFAFRDFFEYTFYSAVFLGPSFILTGLILFFADRAREHVRHGKDLDSISYIEAVFMGLAQAVAIIPAISRSGATISMGLLRGLKKELVIKFSFLMSIPAIIGPAVFDARSITIQMLSEVGAVPLIFAMIAAGVAGYFSIRFMLDFFTRASFKVFSYYVFVLGGLIILDELFFHIVF